MVFHPQEFGNVATCCAYLEGAGLGPGAAVARSDGVAWRRVSINYSHNYSRRPAASRCSPSPPTSAAIRIPNWTQRWWWDARSKGVCVCVNIVPRYLSDIVSGWSFFILRFGWTISRCDVLRSWPRADWAEWSLKGNIV